MANHLSQSNGKLLASIRQLLADGRKQVAQTVNATMVQTYWQIGRLIVEDEQQGQTRAEYGKAVLKTLSAALTQEFGKGFDASNLRNMRLFYLAFPNRDAVRHTLSWTHYRALIRIENEQARLWYMQETVEQAWSARALDRQIGALYYERLLSTRGNKQAIQPVLDEANQKTAELALTAKEYLRDRVRS